MSKQDLTLHGTLFLRPRTWLCQLIVALSLASTAVLAQQEPVLLDPYQQAE